MNRSRPLRVGTRGSALALWQTERVRALLANHGFETERIEIKTTGDVITDVPLAQIGSRALFTKQLDDAMLDGRIDVAVHSLKDLPTALPDGIEIGAVGLREDAYDALVTRGGAQWEQLPQHAVVATSSLRRRAQLLRARSDLRIVEVRGNVDTRLAKLDRHAEWSAIILAAAGLLRLGLGNRISQRMPLDLMLPAPGQGALAATVRRDDARAREAVQRALHDPSTALAVAAERGFLRRLEGGCQVPVAALGEMIEDGGRSILRLHGRIIALAGETSVGGTMMARVDSPSAAEALGVALAEQLLPMGAAAILRSVREAAVVEAVPEP